ncbi:MAG: bifunctional 3-5 exonuclease/DNA polymerase, partial [Nonomuraea muscovyensis]|nr:bifunctional 3-5 exonuclease/DNA polymerase [Nonomuraea muscovyensis]
MYVVLAGETVLPVPSTPAGVTGPAPAGEGAVRRPAHLARAVRELEAGAGPAAVSGGGPPAGRPRWVWADTREAYPPLLDAGVRLSRCHDLALTEGLLLACEGRHGEPRSA